MDTKKLKQKVLDLAIWGKLVPQDPNDEPASKLLERIYAEKQKLIAEGKIKKEKRSSFIFKGEDNSIFSCKNMRPTRPQRNLNTFYCINYQKSQSPVENIQVPNIVEIYAVSKLIFVLRKHKWITIRRYSVILAFL